MKIVADTSVWIDFFNGLRKRGITIRKSNDCLIASICIRNDALLVFRDRDFDLIAQHSPLQILE